MPYSKILQLWYLQSSWFRYNTDLFVGKASSAKVRGAPHLHDCTGRLHASCAVDSRSITLAE